MWRTHQKTAVRYDNNCLIRVTFCDCREDLDTPVQPLFGSFGCAR
jgi:hypothetical protein